MPDPGGGERPVLLCHATGFNGLVWRPLAAHLTGYHALAPDLRGHGRSNAPAGRAMDWDGFADDVLAVVDAWGVDDLVAVGHSKGGAALLMAEERRPGTFAALFCYEPVVIPPGVGFADSSDNPLAQGALRRREVFESRAAAFQNYAGKPPLSVLDPAALEGYVEGGFEDLADGSVRLRCRPEIESAVFRMAGSNGAFEGLSRVRCPVTIARGQLDAPGPASAAQAIVDALGDGHLVAFDDLGHFGPLEQPARVAQAVLAAFADLA